MNSCSDRPFSARRAHREDGSELKRQRSEKTAKCKSSPGDSSESFSVVLQIRMSLAKIEGKVDKSMRILEEPTDGKGKKIEQAEPESKSLSADMGGLLEDLKRIEKKMTRHVEISERVLTVLKEHSSEMKKLRKVLDEARMERDVLLERVHTYLEQNSVLKSKIEEQRCSIGAYERQVNAEYEVHLRKLESMNEDLKNVAAQKDKQLKEANEQLMQMCKALKSQETLYWKKKNEENVFISILKNDLQTIWNEKIKMEEEFKRLKRLYGFTDHEIQLKVSSEDYMGTLLRRSKSMSDLTVEGSGTNHADVECDKISLKRDTPSVSATSSRCSPKTPCGESDNIDLAPSCGSGTSSQQKLYRELMSIEQKLSEQTEEAKRSRRQQEEKPTSSETAPEKQIPAEPFNRERLNPSLENVTQKLGNLKLFGVD